MTAAPASSARRWSATGLVVLAVLAGLLSLDGLLVFGPWFPTALVVVVLVAVVTATVRGVGRRRFAPSVWGLATAVLLAGTLYTGEQARPALPLPTLEAFSRWFALAGEGAQAVADGRIPLEHTRGVELLVVTGALASFLVGDLLAVAIGRAGLSGIALLALWTPAILFERIASPWVLLLGASAFLLLLAVTRAPTPAGVGGAGREIVGTVAAAVAVSLVAIVAGPASTTLPMFGAMTLPSTLGPQGLDGPLRLATDLDMRASLANRSDRTILSYRTSAGALGPLRMYTLTSFDGTSWHRDDVDVTPEPTADVLEPIDGLLWPLEQPDLAEDSEPVEVVIRVGDLDEDRLPVAIGPREVDVTGRWSYDPVRDEVVGRGTSTRDLSYVLTVHDRDLTPETLRSDRPGDSLPAYLEVPDSAFATEIAALAQEVTAGAASTYDQALALQTYFRDISNFRYDTRVPDARTDDAVWDFLIQRTGYCVQFATAMTIMARTLGIPARIGVGFLPGRADTSVMGRYVVSGRQAHAWPELYFADAGWVRFEPTPATQTGAPPVYADPYGGQPVGEGSVPTAAAEPVPSAPATAAPGAGGGRNNVEIGSAQVPLVVVVAVLAALSVLATLGVATTLGRRQRRRHAPPHGPDGWWAELETRLAPFDVTWSDATTPRQVAAQLGEQYDALLRQGASATSVDEARAAITELVGAVEDARYAPSPSTWSSGVLEPLVVSVTRPFEEAAVVGVRSEARASVHA